MIDIIVTVITSLSVIMVAVLQLRTERYRKKREKMDKESQKRKEDEAGLLFAHSCLQRAVGELSYVTAKAVHGEKTNGDVEEAIKKYINAATIYDELEKKITINKENNVY